MMRVGPRMEMRHDTAAFFSIERGKAFRGGLLNGYRIVDQVSGGNVVPFEDFLGFPLRVHRGDGVQASCHRLSPIEFLFCIDRDKNSGWFVGRESDELTSGRP